MISEEDREKLGYLGAWALPLIMPPISAAESSLLFLEEIAKQGLKQLYDASLADIQRLTDDLLAGRISAQEFEQGFSGNLKTAYEQAASYGKYAAGRPRVPSEADALETNKLWDAEQKYARNLVSEYERGKVSDDKFRQRANMYPGALTEVFNRAWAYHVPGEIFSWHLHPRAEHCIACIIAASGHGDGLPTGNYRLKELPFFPGRSPICLDNCMCQLMTANGRASAPAIREPASGGEPSL